MSEPQPRRRRAAARIRRVLGDLRPPDATLLRWLQVDDGHVTFGRGHTRLEGQPPERVHVGEGVVIGDHVAIHLGPEGRIEIGAGTVLGSHVLIAADALVRIGPDCRIGSYAVLVDTWGYGRSSPGVVPVPAAEPVVLGAGAHLGMRAIVGPGVELAAGQSVATGHVRHRDEVTA